MKRIIITCSISILIDQLIKLLIVNNFVLGSSTSIIKNFFSLTYVQNTGAAFSILSGNLILLICITVLALVFIYLFLVKNEKNTKMNLYFYGVLYGGIIGNLIDRIIRGYVVDYLDFNIFNYNFPVFNFADICIVVSILLIVIFSLLEARNGKN